MVINKKYLSTIEAAKVLGISRVAVLKKIYSGELPAIKIGRNYAIDPEVIGSRNPELSEKRKKDIQEAVHKVFQEYGETIKKLGTE